MTTLEEIERAVTKLPINARSELMASLLSGIGQPAGVSKAEKEILLQIIARLRQQESGGKAKEAAEAAPQGEVKRMDRATFEASSKKVFRHYKPLLKALSE